jgi:HAD superfamily hydrolase (TIGR01509 family)
MSDSQERRLVPHDNRPAVEHAVGDQTTAPRGWPAAVLWDMDGTLVDTEPYWIEAEFALAERYGGSWSQEHALNLVGYDLLDSGRYIREQMGIDLEPAQIVEELLDSVVARVEEEVPWQPGARELLAALAEHDVPCALVTMSYRRFVDPVLAALPAGTFRVVVTGDSVSHGKPHPEPYLKAARELRLAPEDCLAVEDSNTGARSAEASGATVLVVPNHVPVLDGPGRVFRDTLVGLRAEALSGLLEERGR